eukprot:5213217-Prymnesium_polylepis.1
MLAARELLCSYRTTANILHAHDFALPPTRHKLQALLSLPGGGRGHAARGPSQRGRTQAPRSTRRVSCAAVAPLTAPGLTFLGRSRAMDASSAMD